MKLLTLFPLYSIVIKHFFLVQFKKPRRKLISILRFCYFSENIVPLKSYYQLSYVSVWLTGILLTIANILIKSWNVHFHLELDWSNAAWQMWWLKQSIKPCKLIKSVVAITNTSCVYLLTCVWLFSFLKVQKFKLSPTLALNYTKAIRSRISKLVFLKFWFYVWH